MQTRYLMEISAIIAGSLSGVLHAWKRQYDIIGIMVIGISTSIGGGILRDILIGHGPPLVIQHSKYLFVVLGSTVLGMFFGSLIHQGKKVLWTIDSLAIGFFAIAGIQRAIIFELDILPALFLGLISSVGGGILRDILCRETPAILLSGQPYTLAALFAGSIYLLCIEFFKLDFLMSEFIAITGCFSLKAIAAYYNWNVPRPPDLYHLIFQKKKNKEG